MSLNINNIDSNKMQTEEIKFNKYSEVMEEKKVQFLQGKDIKLNHHRCNTRPGWTVGDGL